MKPAIYSISDKLKTLFLKYWIPFEVWFRRRWVTLFLLFVAGWLFTTRDISVSFSMEKGQTSFYEKTESSLFYDPFEDEEGTARNVSALSADKTRGLTAEQLEKRRKQLQYVGQYNDLAIKEMHAHGIPASITLAQGLLESNIGRSRLATENNNHFGIKCFSKTCKKGHCSNFNDDHHKDFFRIFGSVEESFAAHSTVLAKQRYRRLYSLDRTDYKAWSRGLRKAGYATDPRYAEKLIRIIEDLDLNQYDY